MSSVNVMCFSLCLSIRSRITQILSSKLLLIYNHLTLPTQAFNYEATRIKSHTERNCKKIAARVKDFYLLFFAILFFQHV